MKCPICSEETKHGGTWATLVGYYPEIIDGVEHLHDDNCLTRRYICINKHAWSESVIRTCDIPGCNWKGKTTCSVHKDTKVEKWSDPENYFDRYIPT